MRILVLEDNPKRSAWFLDQGVTRIEETAVGAMLCLVREPWDALFLDLDLGGGLGTMDAHGQNGRTVAQWIAAHPSQVGRVIVHSTNEPLARLVLSDLLAAGVRSSAVPFPDLVRAGLRKTLEA